MKPILLTIVMAALLTLTAATAFVYSGFHDVSALTPHSAVANWAMSTTMQRSVQRRAQEIRVPNLSDESLVLAGINDFETMCVTCHGAPGKDPEAAGKGLNPPAPDLAQAARNRTPAELFWVTKHGIRMTGMPAWGVTHDDDALWPVVALMIELPGMDASTYDALASRAAGHGHHAETTETSKATGHREQHHPAPGASSSQPSKPEHDHSTHAH